MRILVVTDAWRPQVNGVVRSLEQLEAEARRMGDDIVFLTPDQFRTLPMPGYREIRLSIARPRVMARLIDAANADAIHIATEGPLGLLARRYCKSRKIPFTTCYHTRYPQYLRARLPVPERVTYSLLRRFHNGGDGVMVATEALASELRAVGFDNLMIWSRGVDMELYRPRNEKVLDVEGPIFLCVARLAVEKNLDAFLKLDLPGTKVMVGDGPDRERLEAAYPDAHFLGAKFGEELAQIYAAADVFVFPSRTETFGLVLLEALASGVPVASYPGEGLLADIELAEVGVLNEDLSVAARAAMALSRERCRAFAARYSFERSTTQFIENVRSSLG
jgi:glycosyltransferase involved in cell wall biosynthesis